MIVSSQISYIIFKEFVSTFFQNNQNIFKQFSIFFLFPLIFNPFVHHLFVHQFHQHQ